MKKTILEGAREVPVLAEVDVLVLGAGPAGVSAAICAAREGVNTMMVEQSGDVGGVATMAASALFGWATSSSQLSKTCDGSMPNSAAAASRRCVFGSATATTRAGVQRRRAPPVGGRRVTGPMLGSGGRSPMEGSGGRLSVTGRSPAPSSAPSSAQSPSYRCSFHGSPSSW